MSLAQGFPNTFSATQQTQEVLKNTDNETKKIYTDINSLMAVGGHAHTGNGSDGAKINISNVVIDSALNEALGTPITSSSTINLTTATGNFLHITGTTTITAVTLGVGMRREVIFDGILTLTHHATNNNLPSAANITTAVGDRASYYSDGTTVYCTKYQRADGTALISSASLVVASEAEAIAGIDNTKAITPLRLRNAFNAVGDAPVYAKRAFCNFNGVPLNGTYSQSVTTVTVTMTSHGLSVGDKVNLSITSGTGVSGSYIVATVPNSNTFTYTAGTNLTTSGNITKNIYIRSSGNVSSITDNGVGDYTINFLTALVDANYVVHGTSSVLATNVTRTVGIPEAYPPTASSCRIYTQNDAGTLQDPVIINVSFTR